MGIFLAMGELVEYICFRSVHKVRTLSVELWRDGHTRCAFPPHSAVLLNIFVICVVRDRNAAVFSVPGTIPTIHVRVLHGIDPVTYHGGNEALVWKKEGASRWPGRAEA